MVEIEQFFEDYELGAERITGGRTITETDIVMHAMHSGDFYPHLAKELHNSVVLFQLELH